MNYQQRIEQAVIAMWEFDREMWRLIHHLEDFRDAENRWVIEINFGGLSDIAMNLLGIPQDNTTEMLDKYMDSLGIPRDDLEKANELSGEKLFNKYPETFCRDSFDDIWADAKTGKEFIKYCYDFLKKKEGITLYDQ